MWTSTDLFRVSVLCSAASSSRYRGANSGFGTLLESLSRCQPVLESLSWFDVLLVSLSWYKPWVQQTELVCPTHTPVAIVIQTGGKLTCRNSRTARSLFGVSVLWSAPSSSRYRGASSGFGTLLESLSRCQLGVRHSPRVTIAVPTVGLADWVGLPNPHSCRYRGTNPGAAASSSRYRGSNRGE